MDDYLKNQLTEHFYQIKGEERASVQADVLSDVGWGDDQNPTQRASFNMSLRGDKELDRNQIASKDGPGGEGIAW